MGVFFFLIKSWVICVCHLKRSKRLRVCGKEEIGGDAQDKNDWRNAPFSLEQRKRERESISLSIVTFAHVPLLSLPSLPLAHWFEVE